MSVLTNVIPDKSCQFRNYFILEYCFPWASSLYLFLSPYSWFNSFYSILSSKGQCFFLYHLVKEYCLCHKLWFSNLYFRPNVVDLWYFKLWILLDQIFEVWNIKGLHQQIEKIKGEENLSWWQKHNFSLLVNIFKETTKLGLNKFFSLIIKKTVFLLNMNNTFTRFQLKITNILLFKIILSPKNNVYSALTFAKGIWNIFF